MATNMAITRGTTYVMFVLAQLAHRAAPLEPLPSDIRTKFVGSVRKCKSSSSQVGWSDPQAVYGPQ